MKSHRFDFRSSTFPSLLVSLGVLISLVFVSGAAAAQGVNFYTERSQLEVEVMYNGYDQELGVGMRTFDLTASNVGMADEVPGTPIDGQNLCLPPARGGGSGPCSLTWGNPATGFGVNVTLRPLEQGAALIWNDQGGSGFNAEGVSIGGIGSHLDDDFRVEFSGTSIYGFALEWADNTPSPGETLTVYDTSDQVLATYDLSSFGADDDMGSFIGGLSDVAIGAVMIDDEELTDDTYLRSISAITSAIEVTTFDDWFFEDGDDGECSLREALQAASTNAPVDGCRGGSDIDNQQPIRGLFGGETPDYIHLPAGTYFLDYGPVKIDSLVVVMGDGMDQTFIDGQSQSSVVDNRHFANPPKGGERGVGPGGPGQTATLTELSLENGRSYYGGGLTNHGTLTLYRARIANNVAETGGGIYNPDPFYYRARSSYALFIYESVIEGNLAKVDDTFKDRAPGLEGRRAQGGGIYSASYLQIIASTVQNNRAEGGDDPFLEYQAEGGGAWIGNEGGGLGARGIGAPGQLVISQSTFSGNVAKVRSYRNDTYARGGGIFFSSAYQGIEHSTISGNEALGELASLGIAGGIFAEYQEGAIGCIGCCRLPGCRGEGPAVDLAAFGYFLTLAENEASFAAGAVTGDFGFAFSIVATNTAPIEANCGFSVNLVSDGYNMFESTEQSCPSNETDVFVTLPDTYLGPLADNGGPVLSHRLLEGSPAINASEVELRKGYDCYEYYDGRGFSRMYSGACDIGAYEVGENAFFDFDFDGSDVPGEQATFQIEATNPGYFDLTVDISSVFPEQLENCSWTCEMEEWYDFYFRGAPSSCTAGPMSGDIADFGFVLVGSTIASYDVTCDIPSNVIETIEIPATVVVTEGYDPVPEDNMATFFITPNPMADIETEVEWEIPATGLGPWTVTVTITNNGPSDAASITVREDNGMNLSLDDWDCGNGSKPVRTNATLCLFDSLAAGAMETMTVTFFVTSLDGDAQSSIFASASTSDPNGDNNTFNIDTEIEPLFASYLEPEEGEPADLSEWSVVVIGVR